MNMACLYLLGTLRIWRGCLSLSGVRSSLQGNTRHNEINEEGNKKYTQFCQTNLCNTGNGRKHYFPKNN